MSRGLPQSASQGIERPPIAAHVDDLLIQAINHQGAGRVVPKAGRVIVAVLSSIRRLMESIEGITVVPIGERHLPDFDVHCPLLSLPRAFAATRDVIPNSEPYLRAEPVEQVRWNRPVGTTRLRVGIVWAGNPATMRDRFRSPGLLSMAPLFALSRQIKWAIHQQPVGTRL